MGARVCLHVCMLVCELQLGMSLDVVYLHWIKDALKILNQNGSSVSASKLEPVCVGLFSHT